MTILIVEDDPMVRRLLVRHFSKQHTVVEAPDAEAALTLFGARTRDFDVVVTDVHLPGATGVELATELRKLRADQPIVFVTGDVDEELARRALEGGGAGYLLKPFEFFELDAAVAQAMKAPAVAPSTPAKPVFSSGDATAEWYEDQRRQILAAANQPVVLRAEYAPRRRFRSLGFYIKLGITVLILVGIAWLLGYGLSSEPDGPPPAVIESQQPAREKTIYVPYEPPATEPRRSRERR